MFLSRALSPKALRVAFVSPQVQVHQPRPTRHPAVIITDLSGHYKAVVREFPPLSDGTPSEPRLDLRAPPGECAF
eukprot:45547-Prorocentrum_minimum.AAC.1